MHFWQRMHENPWNIKKKKGGGKGGEDGMGHSIWIQAITPGNIKEFTYLKE